MSRLQVIVARIPAGRGFWWYINNRVVRARISCNGWFEWKRNDTHIFISYELLLIYNEVSLAHPNLNSHQMSSYCDVVKAVITSLYYNLSRPFLIWQPSLIWDRINFSSLSRFGQHIKTYICAKFHAFPKHWTILTRFTPICRIIWLEVHFLTLTPPNTTAYPAE